MESHSSSLVARGLGQVLSKNNNFSKHQIYITQVIGAASAAVSIVCGSVTIYWFMRMRRTFRHHLIMLLVFSDFFKALWYLIFPLANFVQGTVPTASTLCQVNGFMVAFGFEATDFAILVIAIHSAICIFAGRVLRGEAGLYRYRWYAYGSWVVFASLMAGLAFFNRDHAYISQGTFCYLPVRPFWYRLALSWIPRYVILLTITGLYLAIYLYVKTQFKQLGNETRESCLESFTEDPQTAATNRTVKESNYTSEPSSPLRSSNGLSGTTVRASSAAKSSKRSSASEIPTWENYTFGAISPIPQNNTISRTDASVPEAAPVPINQSGHRPSAASSVTNTSTTRVSIAQALRDIRINSRAPTPRPVPEAPASPVQQSDNSPNVANFAALEPQPDPFVLTALRRRHRAIKRQVRYLFIYPLVYMAIWIVPFVSHCLQYSDYFSQHPPFVLQCFTTSILALQCAVDCILFSIREKPWRHIDALTTPSIMTHRDFYRTKKEKGRSGKFWPSLKFWEVKIHQHANVELDILRPLSVPGKEKVGKSRVEMAWDRQLARRRREVEEARSRESWGEIERGRRESEERRKGHGRQWWEQEGKQRNDSVMLGTDDDEDAPKPFYPTENVVRSPTIIEEGGEAPEGSGDDGEGASPKNSRKHSRQASSSHEQDLQKARAGKKPLVYHSGIPRTLGIPNATNMDLNRPRLSDAHIDWAAVYADDDWRGEAGVARKTPRKTKAELEAEAEAIKAAETKSDDGSEGSSGEGDGDEDEEGNGDEGGEGEEGEGEGKKKKKKVNKGKGKAKRKSNRPRRNITDGRVFTPEYLRPPPHLRIDALCREM